MDIYSARKKLKECSIFDLPLKVAYYARVSTEKAEQKTSITHQQDYYTDLIAGASNWTFVGQYIDEGITGVSTEKRADFLRMVNDAQKGKIDLIITKEISRFARNVLDSIQYTRELLAAGTAVWFQNDNINTLDDDSELRLTIMAGIAQDESRRISSRVRFGHARSIEKGVVLGTSNMYGYIKQNGKLSVKEDEAEMVRLIFKKYATNQWSTKSLADFLWECGYRNHKGTKISPSVIANIIRNPKYKGYYVGGKVKIIDLFTKKQKFLPENEWVYYKDDGTTVPALVDEKLWDAANQIYKSRGNAVQKKSTSYKGNLLTGLLYCTDDGAAYWLKSHAGKDRKDDVWVCSHRIKNGKHSCNSFAIKQGDIIKILLDLFNNHLINPEAIAKQYAEYFEKEVYNIEEHEQKKKELASEINILQSKRDKLLDFNLSGYVSDQEFIERNNSFSEQISQKKKQLEELNMSPLSRKELKESVSRIMAQALDYAKLSEEDMSQELLKSIISYIEVKPTGEQKAELTICLLNGYSGVEEKKATGFMVGNVNGLEFTFHKTSYLVKMKISS